MSALEMLKEYHGFRNGAVFKANNIMSSKDIPQKDINANILLCGMSATASSSEVQLARSLGMQVYYPKPLDSNIIAIVLACKVPSGGNPDKWSQLVKEEVERTSSGET